MVSVKEGLPTYESLELAIGVGLKNALPLYLASTKAVREKSVTSKKKVIVGVALFVFLIVVMAATGSPESGFADMAFIAVFAVAIFLIYHGYQWFKAGTEINKELAVVLTKIISEAFGVSIQHETVVIGQNELKKDIERTGLISESFNQVTIDDRYCLIHQYPMTIKEISLTEKGSKSSVVVFSGFVAEVNLPKSLTGEVYISTEGDTFAESSIDWWNNSDIQKTTLEWNQFENDLHIATNNPLVTREVLTPDFMVDLHSWWQEDKKPIRIAFKGNKMFILFPETSIRLGFATDAAEFEALQEYAMQVAKPIWRILCLVEEVRV